MSQACVIFLFYNLHNTEKFSFLLPLMFMWGRQILNKRNEIYLQIVIITKKKMEMYHKTVT